MNQSVKPLPRNLIAFLGYFIRPAWHLFFLLFIVGLLWAINQVLIPLAIKLIIDNLTTSTILLSSTLLSWPALLGLGLWLILTLSGPSLMELWAIPPFRARIRRQMLDYTYHHSHQFFTNHQAGRIAQKVSDLPRNAEMLIQTLFFSFIPTLITFFIALGLLWHTGLLFGITLLIWGVCHLLSLIIFYPWCQSLAADYADKVSRLTGQIVDSITNIINVRLFARHNFELDSFDGLQQSEIKAGRRALWANEAMKFVQALLAVAMVIIMMLLLYRGWQQQTVSIGDFALVALASINMMTLAWFLQFNLALFLREAGSIKAALLLLNTSHDIVDSPTAKAIKVNSGTIAFEQVTFSYTAHQPIFKELSVTIPGGQKVGLVGLSGAGKSTFINLMLRLYDIESGCIKIDGQVISEVCQQSLHSHIALIPQETLLFNRTLKENIRYGRLDANDEAIIAATKKAQADEFIMQLPQGYDTLVGERGIKLSGGQRQRITIARAILKNAPILMLDEATAALDSVTEKVIQSTLQYIIQNKTTIVIAHRLSTLKIVDRILVFDKGKIIEDGSHDELLSQAGYYAKLWRLQSGGFLPEHWSKEEVIIEN